MASISQVNGSSSLSSIYGSRNVISGLASGMDTETMIENAVSGIQARITALQQKSTKVEWQQSAFRNIIDQILNFGSSYSSYSSSSNLSSPSFFNSASLVNTSGKYADKVSATGKTTSKVQLLGVKQLAKAATYSISGIGKNSYDLPTILGESFDPAASMDVSTVSGSLVLNYGGNRAFSVNFEELDVYKDAGELAKAIEDKLGEQKMTLTDGTSVAVSDRIGVRVNYDNQIEFYDKAGAGNTVYISGASGDIAKTLGIRGSTNAAYAPTSIDVGEKSLSRKTTKGEYLQDQTLQFTLNGKTKNISLKDKITSTGEDGKMQLSDVVSALNSELSKAFGTNQVKVSAADVKDGKGLKFETQQGSALSIGNGRALGLDTKLETTYLDTSKSLGKILGDDVWDKFDKVAADGKVAEDKNGVMRDAKGNRVKADDDGKYWQVDDEGDYLHDFTLNGVSIGKFSKNSLMENVTSAINRNTEAGVSVSYSRTTNSFAFTATETGSAGKIEFGDGLARSLFGAKTSPQSNFSEAYGLDIPEGETKQLTFHLGTWIYTGNSSKISSNDSIEDIAKKLNDNDQLTQWGRDYEFFCDKNTGQLMVVDKQKNETRAVQVLESSEDNATEYKFAETNATSTYGQDAIFSMMVNGEVYDGISRTGNTFDVDGMTMTLKGTFGDYGNQIKLDYNDALEAAKEEAVDFTYTADADKIVDAIKTMVDDYNKMVTDIKKAYSTMPLTKNGKDTGDKYEPLTESDLSSMSESAIAAYEEKAKTGLLFADRDLANLYSKLTSIISPAGQDGEDLRAIGLETAYSDGMTTLKLDETKLRNALAADPDKVKDVFTKTVENGASSNGLMASLQETLDVYAKSTGVDKGILVEKAGSARVPTSIYNNALQQQLDKLGDQIDKWQDKLSDKVDYYTRQFTILEQLIAEMNSQSSALMGLMGTGTSA